MQPSFVLFDVDGTLVDTAGAGRRALEEAFRRVHRVPEVTALTAAVRFGGKTDPAIVAEMADRAGVPAESIQLHREAFERAYLTALKTELARPDPRRRVLPGVLSFLECLAARPGVHLGLVTGNVEPGARAKLDPFGLNRFFATGGFGSDHVERRAVARRAVERMAARAGVDPADARVVVVGDTEHDVDCARANGYRAVAVLTGWTARELLAACAPDALLPDLGDLETSLRALHGDRHP